LAIGQFCVAGFREAAVRFVATKQASRKMRLPTGTSWFETALRAIKRSALYAGLLTMRVMAQQDQQAIVFNHRPITGLAGPHPALWIDISERQLELS